jgi:hypothetical protein
MGRLGVVGRGLIYGNVVATLAVFLAVMIVTGSARAFGSRPGQAPGTLHVRFGVVDGVVGTNGPYTVITRPSGARIVVDETSGRRARLRLPNYCRSPKRDSILGDGWLLEPCDTSRLALYSVARRHWRSIAVAPGCVHFHAGRGSSCFPTAVGTDWIQFDEESTHFGDVNVFQNIHTGALRRDPTGTRTFPDLDSPRLARRLCAPLRVPSHTFVFFAFQGPFVLATDEAGPRLERCGTSRYWVLSGALQAAIGPGTVMWIHGGGRGLLDGIFIPSLRRFRVTLPPQATRVFYVQLSDRHIYLSGSTKRNLSVTWSAPLPVANPS